MRIRRKFSLRLKEKDPEVQGEDIEDARLDRHDNNRRIGPMFYRLGQGFAHVFSIGRPTPSEQRGIPLININMERNEGVQERREESVGRAEDVRAGEVDEFE
jgi:hypothetical protein